MITSNEPGLYLTGKFGVRIENLVLCRKDPEHSGHLSLETLTMAPYDREAIVAGMLTREEIAWLNNYHQKVYDLISPHLTKEERDWLFEETRPIG